MSQDGGHFDSEITGADIPFFLIENQINKARGSYRNVKFSIIISYSSFPPIFS